MPLGQGQTECRKSSIAVSCVKITAKGGECAKWYYAESDFGGLYHLERMLVSVEIPTSDIPSIVDTQTFCVFFDC